MARTRSTPTNPPASRASLMRDDPRALGHSAAHGSLAGDELPTLHAVVLDNLYPRHLHAPLRGETMPPILLAPAPPRYYTSCGGSEANRLYWFGF